LLKSISPCTQSVLKSRRYIGNVLFDFAEKICHYGTQSGITWKGEIYRKNTCLIITYIYKPLTKERNENKINFLRDDFDYRDIRKGSGVAGFAGVDRTANWCNSCSNNSNF